MTVWFEKGRGKTKGTGKHEGEVGGYRFDFWLFNVRHTAKRGWPTEREAQDAENELRRSLRRQEAGLEPATRALSPRFHQVAGAYLQFVKDRDLVTDLDTVDRVQRVILRFFGAKPADPINVVEGEPYYDLRLQDVVDHPTWILKFEDWMLKRGVKGATRNRYRSACSRLYWFAMLPDRREESGITSNPFRGLLRDRERSREVVLTADEIRAIMQCAPDHLRLLIVIAALAPKLRLGNVLALRWKDHVDPAMTVIQIRAHKTERVTNRPLVAPISGQLRRILQLAKARQPKQVPWVIHYRGGPVRRVVTGLTAACEAAGVTYGRAQNGATFHTIRHSAATLLAQLGVPEGLRKDVMGHLSIQTTQGYTHLKPIHELKPLEELSAELPLEDMMTAPRLVGRGGTPGGTRPKKWARAKAKAATPKRPPGQRRKATLRRRK